MNEVRQNWMTLKTPRSSIVVSGNTTWYDVPAPVIVHGRHFHEESNGEDCDTDVIGKNAEIGKVGDISGEVNEDDRVNEADDDLRVRLPQSVETEETLYENNVEAKLNSLNKAVAVLKKPEDDEVVLQKECVTIRQTSGCCVSQNGRKRHSSSIELTAATTVKTDPDGVPTITFSFFRSDEIRSTTGEDCIDEVDGIVEDTSVIRPQLLDQQLYDFPRSSRSEANLASLELAPSHHHHQQQQQQQQQHEASSLEQPVALEASEASEVARDVLYDVVSSEPYNRDSVVEIHSETSSNVPEASQSEKGFKGRGRRGSSKSLRWRRSLGKLEDLVRPGHTLGSHSDSETPESGAKKWTIGRPQRKLGKAWGRMRNWLSEERTKIGEVVARHARLQAVGARLDDVTEEGSARGGTTGLCNIGANTGSYDLTKARVRQDEGSLPRVEEFGLSRVVVPIDETEDVGSGNERTNQVVNETTGRSQVTTGGKMQQQQQQQQQNRAIKKTASSDDILAEEVVREKPPATSFSLERLCSDAEDEEEGSDKLGNCGERKNKRDLQRRFARGGLIKRRMLGSIRGLIASTHLLHESEESGPGGFEEVRRYVKQGGDFCKELAAILHERAELEANYAKGLSKLSGKLTKACAKDQGGNGSGGVSEAWRCVGEEMEAAAEAHRAWGGALSEQLAKPLRVGVAEVQGRTRKSIENSVDKASKSLQEWRTVAAKTKKQSFACARENERLQDLARLQSISQTHQQQQQQSNNNKLTINGHHHHHHGHHMTEKEATKLETRRRKAEDSARRADTEFYTVTVRAERARLEYECAVRKAAKQMELLEEERLSALKDFANVYLAHLQALAPKLQQSADRLSQPIRNCSVAQDVEILKNLIRRIDGNDSSSTEQLLPDFYAEHVTLAMNRERRKQALVRVLHLIRQDLERERRGREGLETLHRAFIKTPAFAADESTQNVTDKLLHMRSMLTYLEAARYKVGGALSELEGGKRGKHPLAEHILVSRDKQGLQQSVLKVPSWAKNESFELQDTSDGELEVLQHLSKESEAEQRDAWADRTAGDGNSENPPDEEDFSDFDEFSSNSEDNNNQDVDSADVSVAGKPDDGLERCRAIYQYSANLNDELSLTPGDLITVHEKQADGWWIGECRGRTGIFPATYVQVIN